MRAPSGHAQAQQGGDGAGGVVASVRIIAAVLCALVEQAAGVQRQQRRTGLARYRLLRGRCVVKWIGSHGQLHPRWGAKPQPPTVVESEAQNRPTVIDHP